MSLAEKLEQAKQQGISRDDTYTGVRERLRAIAKEKGQELDDKTLDYVMEQKGYTKMIDDAFAEVANTRWNQEAKQYGDKYSSYLKDRYGPMLESKEGREEFQTFARDRLQATDQQISDFMGTLDKDTKDETWRKYYRAGMEGIGQAGTGIMQTVNDIAGLFGLEAFDQEQLDKDRGDYDYIEATSEAKNNFDWTDPRNYTSPEALRNVAFFAPYAAMEANMAAKAVKNVAQAGRLAKTAAYALPSAAVTYTQSRAEKDKAEAGVDAAIAGGVGALLGNVADAAIAGYGAWTGKKASEKFVKGLEADPEKLAIMEEAMKKASDLDLTITRTMLPDQIAVGETARAFLRNIAFKAQGSELVDYNSAKLFQAFMPELDKLGKEVDHNKITSEIKDLINKSKNPDREVFSSIRNTYGDRGLYKGPEFQEAMINYLERNKQAAYIDDMEKITKYLEGRNIKNYRDGEEALKELRNPDTYDYMLGTINNQAKKDYADMFEEHILKKTLPEEAAKVLAEAKSSWGPKKGVDKKFERIAGYFEKDTDQARDLFPLSTNDSKRKAKLEALKTIREYTTEAGREDIPQQLAADYMRSNLSGILKEISDMQGTTHPIIKIGKAFKKMDMEVIDSLLPADKAKEIKAYNTLFQSVAAEAEKYHVKGGTLGQVFDIISYAGAQTLIAPSSFLFSKLAGRDMKQNIREAIANIKKGKPAEALKKVEEAFPEATKRIDQAHSLKSQTGEDTVKLYSENKNLNRLTAKAGLEQPKTWSTTPVEGASEEALDSSKVLSLQGLKRYNEKASVSNLLQNPVLLRALKSKGYEAVVVAEKDGKPSRVLDLRGDTYNPKIAEQRNQVIASIDITKRIEGTPKVSKQPLVKDSSQPTPDNIIDVKSGELVENKPAPAPAPAQKLTKEQKASLKRMEKLIQTYNKIADMPDKSKKTAKFLESREKHLLAQIKKNQDLKQSEQDKALRETWEKMVTAADNARISIREAKDALEAAKTKRASMDTDNANKRQKTQKKNQDNEIMTQNTNLETQEYSRFVAEEGRKYKTIDEMHEAFKAKQAEPAPSEPFTVAKKSKKEPKVQEEPKVVEEKPKKAKKEPKVQEEPKVVEEKPKKLEKPKEEPKAVVEEKPKKVDSLAERKQKVLSTFNPETITKEDFSAFNSLKSKDLPENLSMNWKPTDDDFIKAYKYKEFRDSHAPLAAVYKWVAENQPKLNSNEVEKKARDLWRGMHEKHSSGWDELVANYYAEKKSGDFTGD